MYEIFRYRGSIFQDLPPSKFTKYMIWHKGRKPKSKPKTNLGIKNKKMSIPRPPLVWKLKQLFFGDDPDNQFSVFICLDQSRASDTVSHFLQLSILSSLGFQNTPFSCFLSHTPVYWFFPPNLFCWIASRVNPWSSSLLCLLGADLRSVHGFGSPEL